MKRTPTRIRLCISLLIVNLLFIWGNSALPGEISGTISGWIKDWILKLMGQPPSDAVGGHGLLRKLAHFTEFCTLGLCLCWLFKMMRPGKIFGLAVPITAGFLVACIDETIQIFVPGRGPGIKDVGIDTLGVITGIILINLFTHRKNNLEDIHV